MELPSMYEYFDGLYETYSPGRYSKALFKCPKCGDGEVHRDDQVILTSYPPKNLYKCFDCGAEFYR